MQQRQLTFAQIWQLFIGIPFAFIALFASVMMGGFMGFLLYAKANLENVTVNGDPIANIIITLFAGIWVVISIFRVAHKVSIIENGRLVAADPFEIKETNTKYNGQPIFEIEAGYTFNGQPYTFRTRSKLDHGHLQKALILVHPDKPDQALLTAALPDSIEMQLFSSEKRRLLPSTPGTNPETEQDHPEMTPDRSYKNNQKLHKDITIQRNVNSIRLSIHPPLVGKVIPLMVMVFFLAFFFSTVDVVKMYRDIGGMAFVFLFPFLVVLPIAVLSNFRVKRIDLNRREVKVSSSIPYLFRRSRKVQIDQFEQLYTFKRVVPSRNGSHTSYEIHGILKDSKADIMVLDSLPNAATAYFIETEMEKMLQIEDYPVKGEHTPKDDSPIDVGKRLLDIKEQILGH